MKKIEIFSSLFLSMLSCFVIGLYASSEFKYNEPIHLSKWISSVFFCLFFLTLFFEQFKKK